MPDLRGRRVSLDVEGSGTLVDALLVLDAFGLTPADLQAVHVPPAQALDLMTAGELDAMFLVAGYPAAIVTEATRTCGARWCRSSASRSAGCCASTGS